MQEMETEKNTLSNNSVLLVSVNWAYTFGHLVTVKPITQETKHLFLLKYIFQLTLYSLWRERNNRWHLAPQSPTALMVKMIDMQVRNRCLTINVTRNRKYDGLFQSWLATRFSFSMRYTLFFKYQTILCF